MTVTTTSPNATEMAGAYDVARDRARVAFADFLGATSRFPFLARGGDPKFRMIETCFELLRAGHIGHVAAAYRRAAHAAEQYTPGYEPSAFLTLNPKAATDALVTACLDAATSAEQLAEANGIPVLTADQWAATMLAR